MKYKNPFCPEKNEIVKSSIALMESGVSWKSISMSFRDEETMRYVAERLVRIGYLWVGGFDLSDKEIRASLEIAKKTYPLTDAGQQAVATEKRLLLKPDQIFHTDATFVFATKNGVAVDEDLLDYANLDYVDIMKTENQEGWYVLNHNSEPVFMDIHSSELM